MRKIIHIDMDCYYAAVEMRENPALKNVPIAVGGDTERGVLCTSNYLARQYGVRSAMSSRKAKLLCPELQIIPMQMALYKSISNQIREIFQQYTDLIEPLSLDEAYLDVTDCTLFDGSATLIAQDILSEIFKQTGLTASAGIAPIKFLAKVASDLNKPNGHYVIPPNQVINFIEQMPLSKIPGVGKVTFKRLKDYGLEYGRDIRLKGESELVSKFGKLGLSLWKKCNGIDNREIETSRVRKSVGVEHTFTKDSSNIKELSEFMTEKLIPELTVRYNKYANSRVICKLGVKVKFNDFIQTTKELKYDSINPDILGGLLEEAVQRGNGKSIRLLGVHVGLADINNETEQLTLFDQLSY